ncbi:MAG TPA: hypothetical protein VFN35_13365, partial [Ktedonobacteraceae bacterium]|nr:hypothetical protein [Ktedonobacteraceae bacterium]
IRLGVRIDPEESEEEEEALSTTFWQAADLSHEEEKVANLLANLQEHNRWKRREAFDQIHTFPHMLPLEILLMGAADSEDDIRRVACWQLYRADPQGFAQVAEEAGAILCGQGSGQVLGSILQGFLAQIIGEMETLPPPLLARLVSLLKWPHWEVQMRAAEAVGRLHIPLTAELKGDLYELYQNSPSPAVRAAADDALTELLSLEI